MSSGSAARSGLQQLAAVVLQPQISNCCISGLPVHSGAISAAVGGLKCFGTSSSAHGSEHRSWSSATAGAIAGGAALLAAGTAAAAAAADGPTSASDHPSVHGPAAGRDDHSKQDGQQQQQQWERQAQWQQQQQQRQHGHGASMLSQLVSSVLQQHFTAAADAAPQQPQQQQQQQQRASWSSGPGGPGLQGSEPLSGAIASLDEEGLTNHPLDYNPITNEHTAAMTLAKQAGLEAYQAGRYGEAERRFKEALVEARAGFPPNDPHIPSALHYLAEFYRNTGRLDEAEPLYRETLQQIGDTLGERHWIYSAALCSLAALHEARGEYTQAIRLLESALELRRQLFSNSSFLYADTAALLAKTLMQQHSAAAAEAAAAAGSSGSSGGGWFGRGSKESVKAAVPADVSRAIGLWQQAVRIVEESGSVADTPVVPWLLDLAAAQRTAQHSTAAVASLQKALEYMALPPQQDQQQQQQQQGADSTPQSQQQQQGASIPLSNSSSSSSSEAGEGVDTLTAVMAASGGNQELARLKLGALASEVAERLVDAQLAAGDLMGARATLRQALEARMALLGRHLVVAKTMSRLAMLLMQEPADPAAPQLAPNFASSAVAIADTALQTAQRASLWRQAVRGALKAVQTASFGGYKAGLEAGRTSDRLFAAIQLGNASLALAAAEKMNGRLAAAESALRHGVTELRWVLGAGATDLQRISSSRVEPSLLQRVGGLMVDLKLLQMDLLETLADSIRQQAAAAAAGGAAEPGAPTKKKKSKGAKQQSAAAVGGVEPEEVAVLLAEADRLAAELIDDGGGD